MPSSVFVTGTDTGVGKTFASCVLLHALRAKGQRAVGMKPVASGCEQRDGEWRNADALALQEASDPRPAYALVNPFALPQPTAPQIAAVDANVEVCLEPMLAAFELLRQQADSVVVEGVGGWLAPMADGLEQADLARALRLPVVMVVGLKLGCLNHARLTARAVLADGLPLKGWIVSDVDPALAHAEAYFGLLQSALPAPCLGRLPHRPDGSAAALAGTLRFD